VSPLCNLTAPLPSAPSIYLPRQKECPLADTRSLSGQTSPRNPTADTNSDFLTRERAALGDDAAQFAGANDNAATVEDGGDEDLLGGDGDYEDGGGGGGAHNGNGMMDDFESSFPAVDTRNEVCVLFSSEVYDRRAWGFGTRAWTGGI